MNLDWKRIAAELDARGWALTGPLLTPEQLDATNSSTVYDAVAKLRPEWLQSRGPISVTDATPTLPSVYLGGNRLGTVEALRAFAVNEIGTVRYWDAGRASARFGMGHPRGVIELVRR